MSIVKFKFIKTILLLLIALSWSFIGTYFTLGADPPPSPSVGGPYLIINNKTKYNIIIEDLTMKSPNYNWDSRPYTTHVKTTIPAHKTGIRLGDNARCNVPFSSTCYWGAKDWSDTFTISSDNFSDPNKKYPIKISDTPKKIPLESLKNRDREGYCTYPILIWETEWKKDHQEITFTESDGNTSRSRDTCRK